MRSRRRRGFALMRAGIAGCLAIAVGAEPEQRNAGLVEVADVPWSFARPPFVSPKLVKDFATQLSDSGDQVVAINLADAQGSNRYHAEVEASDSCHPRVSYASEDGMLFGYRYIGMTASGVHVLRTYESGGGSGAFNSLMLLAMRRGHGFDCCDWLAPASVVNENRPRLVLEKLGQITLGDRWLGSLRLAGNALFVGRGEERFARREGGAAQQHRHVLTIALQPEAPLDFARHQPCAATP